MSESGHGQNVRHEVFGQEADQNETGGDPGPERANYVEPSQYRSEYKIPY